MAAKTRLHELERKVKIVDPDIKEWITVTLEEGQYYLHQDGKTGENGIPLSKVEINALDNPNRGIIIINRISTLMEE